MGKGGPFSMYHRVARTLPVEIISTRDVAPAVRRLGGRIEADINGRVTAAEVPADAVGKLARTDGVIEVYPSLPVHATLDRSAPEIRAPSVWAMTASSGLPVRGNHVLVGIVDSGIDYRNLDFRRTDGTSRIKYIWDQTQDGHAPAGYSFGFECDAASIDSGGCPERDTDGHGTHVAGIAAGNGRSSNPAREIGIAPESDIIVVKRAGGSSNVLAAWKYLIDKAHQLGEPIVINNSFGNVTNPHDGSSPVSLAADELAGPGRIFVAAAGNEANDGVHADGALSQNGAASIGVNATGRDTELKVGVFFPAADDMPLTVKNLDTGEAFGPIGQADSLDSKVMRDGDTTISISEDTWDSHFRYAVIQLGTSSGAQLKGHFSLQLAGADVADSGRYDAWIEQDDAGAFTQPDEADTINAPADSRSVIAVGNYATRVTWTDRNNDEHNVCDGFPCQNHLLRVGDIAWSSSTGPTADGRQKPDIAAPGTMILSSLSHDAPVCVHQSDPDCLLPLQITADGKNLAETGTSMSSPHVAGVVALMLQTNPTLDEASVTAILRSTARHDAFTGSAAWGPTFGAGKLDALAAVQAAEGQPRTFPVATSTPPPAAIPTATATSAPPTFAIDAVRLQKQNRNRGAAVHNPRAGTTAFLFVYWTVTNGPIATKPSYAYTASVSGKVVARGGFTGARPSYDSGRYHGVFPVTLKREGRYIFNVSVTVAGVTRASVTTATVRAKR